MAESVLCKEVIQIVEDKARGKDIIFWIFYYIRYQINNSKRIKQHFNKSIDNIYSRFILCFIHSVTSLKIMIFP